MAWTIAALAGRDVPGRDELAIALAMRRGEQPGAARRSDHDQFGPQRADAALVCDEGGDLSVAELVQNPGAEGAWAKIIEGVLGEPAAQRLPRSRLMWWSGWQEQRLCGVISPGDDEWPSGLDDLRPRPARFEPSVG